MRRGAEYHVKNSIAPGKADHVAVYGRSADDVYVGDWDGDSKDTFAVRRGAEYFIASAIRAGKADRTVVFGWANDTTLVGDWNGDGADSLGLRRTVPAPTPAPAPAPTPAPAPGLGPRPASPDLDCPDFSSWAEAQTTLNYWKDRGLGDVHRLDADNDGIACESHFDV